LRNIGNNDVAEQCNPTMHGRFKDTIQNIPQPQAWHGLKVEMLDERDNHNVPQILRIQTSFSKEYVKIEWSKLPNYL
jgi:hypothetical protein